MKKPFIIILLLCFCIGTSAQQITTINDTITGKQLDSVTLIAYLNQNIIRQLPDVAGTFLFAGKKTEVINVSLLPADLTNKIGRQVFAKIPGIFVYDMDGTGNQVNIAARGLDPHRGWEFNIRKDGIITNSDMYGYPASHYSMPLESIERIELVRGTGSLQYGAQFGGMLNYVSKQGDTTRPVSFENVTTVGSFNLLSTYNAIGGKKGKFRYYAYIEKKSRDGYRKNEHTSGEAQSIALTYEPTTRFSVKLEWSRSKYVYRIPGPLTDSMFYADPKQSSRSRNYFSPDIHIPSININWQASHNTKIQLISSAVLGYRNSIQYDKTTGIKDTINAVTMQYNNRQVDIDAFHSYTTEVRVLHQYTLGSQMSSLTGGVQYMNTDLHRTQLGKGTTGSDFDLTLVTPGFGRDVHFKTKNIAFFAENKFQLLSNFSISAGARVEDGRTNLSGTISYYPENAIPVSMSHHFPLFGASFSYKPVNGTEVYGGFSQAYRPMLFKDLIPTSLYEKVDPNIRDAKGYNAEVGVRGHWKFLRWDVNGYVLQYDHRFGTLAQTDNTGALILYRTNIGNSLSTGAEIFIQADWVLRNKVSFSLFTSTAFMHARYTNAIVKSGTKNIDIRGNKVESAPDVITRNGATVRYKMLTFSALYSYTASTFADALNTVVPPKTTGAIGLVPAYGLLDLNTSIKFSKMIDMRFNLSNVTNKQYFTKRPTFYPGPGVWPSDGRNGSVTLAIRL